MTRVVVLGGGFGGVAAATHLSKAARHDKGIEVRLINRTNFLTYTPFLADVAGGTLAVAHAAPPVRTMAPLAEHEVAEIEGVDIAGQRVHVRLPDGSRAERAFDYLVIALGATTTSATGPARRSLGCPCTPSPTPTCCAVA